jgi:hypothetical protein
MLPALLLGTNICPLRPFVEWLAFSTIWVNAVLFSHYVLLIAHNDPQEVSRSLTCASQNRLSLPRLHSPMRGHKSESGKMIRACS